MHHIDAGVLKRYVLGQLPDGTAIEEHLAVCAECRYELAKTGERALLEDTVQELLKIIGAGGSQI